jgi:hypothetical protein
MTAGWAASLARRGAGLPAGPPAAPVVRPPDRRDSMAEGGPSGVLSETALLAEGVDSAVTGSAPHRDGEVAPAGPPGESAPGRPATVHAAPAPTTRTAMFASDPPWSAPDPPRSPGLRSDGGPEQRAAPAPATVIDERASGADVPGARPLPVPPVDRRPRASAGSAGEAQLRPTATEVVGPEARRAPAPVVRPEPSGAGPPSHASGWQARSLAATEDTRGVAAPAPPVTTDHLPVREAPPRGTPRPARSLHAPTLPAGPPGGRSTAAAAALQADTPVPSRPLRPAVPATAGPVPPRSVPTPTPAGVRDRRGEPAGPPPEQPDRTPRSPAPAGAAPPSAEDRAPAGAAVEAAVVHRPPAWAFRDRSITPTPARPAPLAASRAPHRPAVEVVGGRPTRTEPVPVQVRIGTVEVRAAAPPAPAGGQPRPGFGEYRSMRAYAGWWLDGGHDA